MAECRATYDFCGAGLILEAEEAAIADMFARGFGSFLCDGSRTFSEQPFLLRIRKGEQSIATDLPLVWSGAFPEGGSGRLFEDAERCLLEVTGSCRVDIEPGSRRAVVSLADGGMRRFMGSASMLVLDLTLLAGGQHLVHGASLLRPATGGAILVCGPSGRGKTTTSIALARGGFGLMTDDASVLTLDGGRVRVWGMPRALKVHRRGCSHSSVNGISMMSRACRFAISPETCGSRRRRRSRSRRSSSSATGARRVTGSIGSRKARR
jgi:hypothetical protein